MYMTHWHCRLGTLPERKKRIYLSSSVPGRKEKEIEPQSKIKNHKTSNINQRHPEAIRNTLSRVMGVWVAPPEKATEQIIHYYYNNQQRRREIIAKLPFIYLSPGLLGTNQQQTEAGEVQDSGGHNLQYCKFYWYTSTNFSLTTQTNQSIE